RVKAKVLAGKFGCELGKVVLIQESGGVRPMPMLMERSMAATGFAQGEVEITAQVYAEFEIK
ncbi:MAG: SIMPL domain-containing protein, partial [Candidatus Babeliaceae bacterium]|nr:SIMPL domain-containing protein [Candidatus Babeliaceae bacterium]